MAIHIAMFRSLARTTLAFSTALMFLALPVVAHAGPGDLDGSFGTAGKLVVPFLDDSTPDRIVAQSDGKLVLTGRASRITKRRKGSKSYATQGFVARLNTNGSLDKTFGLGGVTYFGDVNLSSLALAPDGRIFLLSGGAVIVLTPAGAIDQSFGVSGSLQPWALPSSMAAASMSFEADGQLVLGGVVGGKAALTRVSPSGAVDATFGNGGIAVGETRGPNDYSSIAVLADQTIVTNGRADDGTPTLIKFSQNGTRDTSFGTSGQLKLGVPYDYSRGVSSIVQSSTGNIFAVRTDFTPPSSHNPYISEYSIGTIATSNGSLVRTVGGTIFARAHPMQDAGFVTAGGLHGGPWPGSFRIGFSPDEHGLKGYAAAKFGAKNEAFDVAVLPGRDVVAAGHVCRQGACHVGLVKFLTTNEGDPAPRASLTSPGDRVPLVARTFTGWAMPVGRLARVAIAIQRVDTTARRRGICWWLRADRRAFRRSATRKGKCDRPVFHTATGTDTWKYVLPKRLPNGDYRVWTRAIRTDGIFTPFNTDSESMTFLRIDDSFE
jgi:uncharacterized delta-60 repeat protein